MLVTASPLPVGDGGRSKKNLHKLPDQPSRTHSGEQPREPASSKVGGQGAFPEAVLRPPHLPRGKSVSEHTLWKVRARARTLPHTPYTNTDECMHTETFTQHISHTHTQMNACRERRAHNTPHTHIHIHTQMNACTQRHAHTSSHMHECIYTEAHTHSLTH